MALNKATLGTAIADAFAAAHGQGKKDFDTVLGNAIANAIDTYIKAGNVSTTVTGTLPNGPVAANGAGGIT